MPLVCTVKPNRSRKRTFTERDAARICCDVVRSGGSKPAIDRIFRTICGEQPRRPSASEAALELAAVNIQQNTAELEANLILLRAIEALVSLLFAILPFLRLPGLLARIATLSRAANRTAPGLVAARITQVQAQVARNESTFRIVQQAAANERAFRLTGTGL